MHTGIVEIEVEEGEEMFIGSSSEKDYYPPGSYEHRELSLNAPVGRIDFGRRRDDVAVNLHDVVHRLEVVAGKLQDVYDKIGPDGQVIETSRPS